MKILGGCFALFSAWMLAGCNTVETQLLVFVTSDYRVPAELAEIRAQLLDGAAERTAVAEHRFPLSDQPQTGFFQLPISFGVLPIGGDARQSIAIEVQAFS